MNWKKGDRVRVIDGSESNGEIGEIWDMTKDFVVVCLDAGMMYPVDPFCLELVSSR